MKYFSLLSCLVFFIIAEGYGQVSQPSVKVDAGTFGAIKARQIGPARMSGRITSLDALYADERLVYVGTGGGGVWKTTNSGVTFVPVFDQHTMSIGAVKIDQQHPDTVWVGTGEPWVRNSVSMGDGIYKTTDGGKTWKNLGLKLTERIARIEISPVNSNVVYVAALGNLWSSSEERGIFRTTNGGESWEKVLYIDENTGAADLSIDPDDSTIIYAAMWEHRRTPYSFDSGGKGNSGLYQSKDGGNTWTKLIVDSTQPKLGRIAVDVSEAQPGSVYALIEKDTSALYKSDDKGESWARINSSTAMGQRPFYFAYILTDPNDPDKIYKPGQSLSISSDGGQSFSGGGFGSSFHSDVHAIWVSKANPEHIYLGTDGGVYESLDGGSAWRIFRNLPVSQFYHVSADNQYPYNVYGGLQDNGSWMGPSASLGGIENGDWENLGGGDGFYVFPDQLDDNIIYWQSQAGNLQRLYRNTREVKNIKPKAGIDGKELRFNWNTPVSFSRDGKRMYVGSQFLFRSTARGDDWERISPDLSTNDKERLQQKTSGGITVDNTGAENHCTIYTISESPLDSDYIWVGTDDGQLQVTANGGTDWHNVTDDIPELPANTWVSSVFASQHDLTTVYVTFDGHRHGDKQAYVYKSDDLGASWNLLSQKSENENGGTGVDQIGSYVHVLAEDPINENLLFVGAEDGLYLSIDGGKVWSKFTGNVPNVAIRDIKIHPRDHDLILATHGRGIVILDDISPLRNLSLEDLENDIVFLPSRSFVLSSRASQQTFAGNDEFVGNNPDQSALITYYLKKRHIFGEMYIEVLDEEGNLVNKLPAGKRKGINIVRLSTRYPAPKAPASTRVSFGATLGPSLLPGNYKVRIVKKGLITEGDFEIVSNPNSPHSIIDQRLQNRTVWEAYRLVESLAYLDEKILKIAADIGKVEKTRGKRLRRKLKDLQTDMIELHNQLVAKPVPGATRFSSGGEQKLREKMLDLYGSLNGFRGAPSEGQIAELKRLAAELSEREEKLVVTLKPLQELNRELEKAGERKIQVMARADFDSKK